MISRSVSVALATFNGAAHLQAQLKSLTNQSLAPFELVVSDDGSSDGTLDVVAAFATQASFPVVRLENTTRLGFRGNFMRAAAACRGEIVAFCDQDDVWHSDKLKRVHDAFALPETLAFFHNSNVVDAQGRFMQRFYAKPPASERSHVFTLPLWFYPYGFSLAVRRVMLAIIPFWNMSRDPFCHGTAAAHDCLFFWLAASLGAVAYDNMPLVDYRQHGGNVFGQSKPVSGLTRKRLSQAFGNPSNSLAHLAIVARANGDILSRAQKEAACYISAATWQRAVKLWHLAADLNDRRAGLYCGPDLRTRAEAFRRLHEVQGYGEGGDLTFGKRQGVRDLALGVIAAPLVRRLNWHKNHDGSLRHARSTERLIDDLPSPSGAEPHF